MRANVPTEEAAVLIVDDDTAMVRVLRAALTDYKDVRFATNGADALRLCAERKPDVILLDNEMPGDKGFHVCEKLKRDPALREIPVIFVTANDEIEFERRALELGASDFLVKPVTMLRVQLRVRLHLQLKRQLEALRELATLDGLTGIANRRAFDIELEREWDRARRGTKPLSLLLIDIDFFKAFNDRYGHPGGDTALKQVAAAIRSRARRATDYVGRFGGEEFAVVLGETAIGGASEVAENIRQAVLALQIPHAASTIASTVTVSIGVASRVPPRSPTAGGARSLVIAADSALYSAKARGRNRWATAEKED